MNGEPADGQTRLRIHEFHEGAGVQGTDVQGAVSGRAGEAGGVSLWRFLSGRSRAVAKPPRDIRVDALRGLALLMIFINHIPGNPLTGATLATVGLADSADLFVLLAGFAAAVAYGPLFAASGFLAGALRVGRRIAQLYGVQLLLLGTVTALVLGAVNLFDNPLYIEAVNIWPTLNDPVGTIRAALVLRYQPFYIDILPLYIALMAVFPLILALVARSPLAALGLSFALWAGVRMTGLNLPTGPDAGTWFFNPLAWQFIFVIGVVWGTAQRHGVSLPRRGPALALSAFVVVAGFLLKSPWSEVWNLSLLPALPDEWLLESGKTMLAPWRVVYALALVHLIWSLVPPQARWLSGRLPRILAETGRHSLPVFAVGTVLSVAAHIAVVETQSGGFGHFAASVIGCGLLMSLGGVLTWMRSLRPAARPVPASFA